MSKIASQVNILLLCGLAGGCRSANAQEVRRSRLPAQETQHVAGELIVKLKPEAGQALDAALAAGKPPTNTGLAWLNALNARYGVTAIAPLFARQPDVEEIKRKFPERAKRAPPGATIPSLRHIYTLTLRHDAGVLKAATDYGAQPDVEYAEPNYIATIQQGAHAPP